LKPLRKIAQYIAQAALPQFPEQVIKKAKLCILDAVGCGLYGLEFEATRIMLQLAEEWNGRPEASLLGTGLKVPSAFAAEVNGTAIHVADFDDSSAQFRGHPTGVVFPAVLALCEREGLSGRNLLLACTVGVEVDGKLGKVMGPSHYEVLRA
jgi:2-methylcitrate dehydratase PrpD